MKQVLIIFAVLLILLLMISVFGGSVRTTDSGSVRMEHYVDDSIGDISDISDMTPATEDVAAKPPKHTTTAAAPPAIEDEMQSMPPPPMEEMAPPSSPMAPSSNEDNEVASASTIEPFCGSSGSTYANF
jgi:hypothetical protein